ncbi:MAG TPA: winged helix-turn-helix transcriptional regulator [Candidatus Thermoplasmatota archaeon]|nr:winged helix-turn-helix transcriptional regulator [Candidatus Thermoplasmatota archaeon]
MSLLVLFASRGPYRASAGTRSSLLEAVRLQPGASRSELLRLTGLSWGAVAHHVRGMVERGELREHVVGRRSYYYADGAEPSLLPFTRLLRTEPQATDILRVLNRNGPASIQHISRDLDLDRKTVRRHVAAMLQAGIVGLTARHHARFELRSLPLELASQLRGQGPEPRLKA